MILGVVIYSRERQKRTSATVLEEAPGLIYQMSDGKVTKRKTVSKPAVVVEDSKKETPVAAVVEDSKKEAAAPVEKRQFRLCIGSISPACSFEPKAGTTVKGRTPMQAAKKIFTQICRASGEGEHSYSFSIIDIENEAKEFRYSGERTKLESPETIKKNNGMTSYEIYFKNVVKAVKNSKKGKEEAPAAAPESKPAETPVPPVAEAKAPAAPAKRAAKKAAAVTPVEAPAAKPVEAGAAPAKKAAEPAAAAQESSSAPPAKKLVPKPLTVKRI